MTQGPVPVLFGPRVPVQDLCNIASRFRGQRLYQLRLHPSPSPTFVLMGVQVQKPCQALPISRSITCTSTRNSASISAPETLSIRFVCSFLRDFTSPRLLLCSLLGRGAVAAGAVVFGSALSPVVGRRCGSSLRCLDGYKTHYRMHAKVFIFTRIRRMSALEVVACFRPLRSGLELAVIVKMMTY